MIGLQSDEKGAAVDLIDIKLRDLRCRLAGRLVQEKFEAFLRAFERCYDPNQPRDDRGRWTDGGGGTGEPAVTDAGTGNPEARIHLVAGDGSSGYPVDLAEEDARGGHTLRGHVGKSHSYLIRELREQQAHAQKHGDRGNDLRVGSFTSEESATRLVNSTISRNQTVVDEVARGKAHRTELIARFDVPTGYEAYVRTERSEPYIRDTYGVKVVIFRDTGSKKGYRVHTAYPGNFD
jgi:hypothetical protein